MKKIDLDQTVGTLLPIQKDCHVAFKVRRKKHSLRVAYQKATQAVSFTSGSRRLRVETAKPIRQTV